MYKAIEDMIMQYNDAKKVGNIHTASGIEKDLLRFNVTIKETEHGVYWTIN